MDKENITPTPALPPLNEEEIPFEERFKQTVEKIRPYVLRLWEAKKKFIIFNAIVLALTLVYLLFLTKPYFTSTITILPDYGTNTSTLSQLSGLASLAGVSVGQSSPTGIYQKLVTSQSVLAPVVYAKYKTDKYPDSVNLIQYFKIKPDKHLSPSLQNRKMFLKMMDNLTKARIKTDVDRMTQILTINAIMPESKLSADVVNNLARSLDNYIQTQMRTNASEQRRYIGKRLVEVKDSLTFAENVLKDFNEQNRVINQSPSLILQQSRMMRRTDILNAIYLQLEQQYELAKIQEIKDTPVINIEEWAKNPILKSGPKRLIGFIIVMFFSVLMSAGYFSTNDHLKKYWGYIRNK